jgi:hypothetical protein
MTFIITVIYGFFNIDRVFTQCVNNVQYIILFTNQLTLNLYYLCFMNPFEYKYHTDSWNKYNM